MRQRRCHSRQRHLFTNRASATNTSSSGATTTPPTPPPPTPPPPTGGGTGYLYLNEVSPFVDASTTLMVPATEAGSVTPVLTAHGASPSLDAAGNLYTVSWASSTGTIDEYPATSLAGAPVRSLPMGDGTKIRYIIDSMASPAGEILVSDGLGVGVFNANANGNSSPDRYITSSLPSSSGQQPVQPGMITVDSSGDVYAANTTDNASIVVYGPTDNGAVTPSRIISGPLTQMNPGYILGMATDAAGDLYALCSCVIAPNDYHFMVLVFAPQANGNVAPLRVLYSDKQSPYGFIGDGDGMALADDGTLYVASGEVNPGNVYVFAPGASNYDPPIRIITSASWQDAGWSAASSRIAVR